MSVKLTLAEYGLSKALLYDFHCNYVEIRYGDKAKLLFNV